MKKILFLMTLTLVFVSSLSAAKLKNTKLKVGDKAPLFSVPTILYKQFILFDELKKIKKEDGLIIFDFFASWCHACKEEFPDFNKIYEELKKKHIYFYGVGIDSKRSVLWKFVKKDIKVKFPVLFDQNAFKAGHKYGADTILPQLFIIDKHGIVRKIAVGKIEDTANGLKAMIEKIKPGTFPKYKNVKVKTGKIDKKK